MVNLNRKAKFLWKPKRFYIDLYQTDLFINCLGVWVEEIEMSCAGWGGDIQWTQLMEQALLWHQDCNDLMSYVVFRGLKVCMTYNKRERKINHIYLGVCFSQQFWSFGCWVDRLFSLGSTVASSPRKSFFWPSVPFLVITDFLPLFVARENFHYKNLSLPMSINECKALNQNFSTVRFQNSQNWFREILTTFPKVNLFSYL